MSLVRTIEVMPNALRARVYTHEVASTHGKIPCWSFVSDGLLTVQHPEVVMTVRRGRDEPELAYPEDPLSLFATLYHGATQGQRAAVGGCSEFGKARILEHHVLYGDAQALVDVPVPTGALAAVLVNDEELRAARAFGPTRVLARLGQAEAHFPFPTWNERGRRGATFASTFAQSVLAKIAVRISGMFTVTMRARRVTLVVQRSLQAQWQAEIRKLPEAPFAMLALRDPSANGCLVWVPGQGEASAIAPRGSDGARVGGCFVVIASDKGQNGAKMIEDGFAVSLKPKAWRKLRDALADGEPLTVEATDGTLDFALAWRDAIYPAPSATPMAPAAT